jgi:hypothetical protein
MDNELDKALGLNEQVNEMFVDALLGLHKQLHRNIVSATKAAKAREDATEKILLAVDRKLNGASITMQEMEVCTKSLSSLAELSELNFKQIDKFPNYIAAMKKYRQELTTNEVSSGVTMRGGKPISKSMM